MSADIYSTPSHDTIRRETEHIISSFCTFVSQIKGKRLSLQNIFLIVLQEPKIRTILKKLASADTDQEVVQLFIDYDPSILKSKYVTKYINSIKKGSPIVT
jgi:uncharacterized protein with von Willebrand factor type A (vWA) domain